MATILVLVRLGRFRVGYTQFLLKLQDKQLLISFNDYNFGSVVKENCLLYWSTGVVWVSGLGLFLPRIAALYLVPASVLIGVLN